MVDMKALDLGGAEGKEEKMGRHARRRVYREDGGSLFSLNRNGRALLSLKEGHALKTRWFGCFGAPRITLQASPPKP